MFLRSWITNRTTARTKQGEMDVENQAHVQEERSGLNAPCRIGGGGCVEPVSCVAVVNIVTPVSSAKLGLVGGRLANLRVK